MKRSMILLLAVALTACTASRGFDRDKLRNQIQLQNYAADKDTSNVLESKPRLAAPFKLAIYFAPPQSAWDSGATHKWLVEDKEKLMDTCTELKKKKILSDAIIISDPAFEGSDYTAIRSAAAKAGADAVLIINGVGSIDRYNNILGYSYVLLITPLIVMGTEADALFMVNVSMLDVHSRYLYVSAEATGSARQIRPAFFIRETYLINEAKSDALNSLKNELSRYLSDMRTK